MSDAKLEILRKLLLGAAWIMVAMPLIKALTGLVLAWTSAVGDPMGLAR